LLERLVRLHPSFDWQNSLKLTLDHWGYPLDGLIPGLCMRLPCLCKPSWFLFLDLVVVLGLLPVTPGWMSWYGADSPSRQPAPVSSNWALDLRAAGYGLDHPRTLDSRRVGSSPSYYGRFRVGASPCGVVGRCTVYDEPLGGSRLSQHL
jgi:hypothetical protein